MRRLPGAVLGMLLVSACATSVPDSGAGVGFRDYSTYELRQAQSQAAASGRAQGMTPPISGEVVAAAPPLPGTPPPVPTAGGDAEALAAEAVAALNPGSVLPAAPVPAVPQPVAAAPQPVPAAPAADPTAPTGMSDEQDFEAVAARETIQSDAERLAQARASYQQVAPTPLPERSGASDTAVIDFALATSNGVGQKLYDRGGRISQDRFYRACARYGAQDEAQADFLDAGGPQRDPKYLDPDGDGFACFWDPTPFRLARQGAVAAPVVREVVPDGG